MGETASCLARFIHPITPIREKYPNTHRKEILTKIFITDKQVMSIRRGSKATEAYVLCHNYLENVDFYAVSRNVTITVEGPSEIFFEAPIRYDNDRNAASDRSGTKGARTIQRKVSCFCSVSALGKI